MDVQAIPSPSSKFDRASSTMFKSKWLGDSDSDMRSFRNSR